MRRFDYNALADRTWDTDILNLVAKIHEYKGRQVLFARQKPVELERLVEIARIQSTEASNKIEGIVTTGTRMKQLSMARRDWIALAVGILLLALVILFRRLGI